jgi:hypothetical protein
MEASDERRRTDARTDLEELPRGRPPSSGRAPPASSPDDRRIDQEVSGAPTTAAQRPLADHQRGVIARWPLPEEPGARIIDGVTRRGSSPVFVGRRAELERLDAALARAALGQPSLVLVAGEAGVGKSRLMAEFAEQVEATGATALTGGCLDLGSRPPDGRRPAGG